MQTFKSNIIFIHTNLNFPLSILVLLLKLLFEYVLDELKDPCQMFALRIV